MTSEKHKPPEKESLRTIDSLPETTEIFLTNVPVIKAPEIEESGVRARKLQAPLSFLNGGITFNPDEVTIGVPREKTKSGANSAGVYISVRVLRQKLKAGNMTAEIIEKKYGNETFHFAKLKYRPDQGTS